MSRRGTAFAAVLAAMALAAAACNSPRPTGAQQSSAAPTAPRAPRSTATTGHSKYFNQADFDRQMAQRRITPQGDPATPWLQMINPSLVDTGKYAKPDGGWHVCFSNAG